MTCQDVVRLSDAGIFPKNLASQKRFLQLVSRARKIQYPDRLISGQNFPPDYFAAKPLAMNLWCL
jgi:hypothetical protein